MCTMATTTLSVALVGDGSVSMTRLSRRQRQKMYCDKRRTYSSTHSAISSSTWKKELRRRRYDLVMGEVCAVAYDIEPPSNPTAPQIERSRILDEWA